MIGRRAFLGAVAVGALAGPRCAEARPPGVPRVGVLGEVSPVPWTVSTAVAHIESRFTDGRDDRFAELASDLVARDVDVIVALGAAAARAVRARTRRIPLVVVADEQLGETADVAALARATPNVTWLTVPSEVGMAQQRVRLLGSLARVERAGVLFDSGSAASAHTYGVLRERIATPRLVPCPASAPGDIERAVTGADIDALVVLPETLFSLHATTLTRMVADARLPAVYGSPRFVEAGGLSALYGDTAEAIRETAAVVRDVLAGRGKPSPRRRLRARWVVNPAAAKSLGLALPSAAG